MRNQNLTLKQIDPHFVSLRKAQYGHSTSHILAGDSYGAILDQARNAYWKVEDNQTLTYGEIIGAWILAKIEQIDSDYYDALGVLNDNQEISVPDYVAASDRLTRSAAGKRAHVARVTGFSIAERNH